MSRQAAESKDPDSSGPRSSPRGNDLLFEELEEGQVNYEESRGPTPVTCRLELPPRGRTAPRRALRAPNPFAERYNLVRALRDVSPLSSRYEEDRRDPNVITNDLDEAQSCQLYMEPSSQRSNRPVAQPLTLPSLRDYGFQPLDPAETSNRGTRAIARKLETLQLESWMKNDKTMIDAFQLLKLNEEGTTLLKSPVLTTWVSYVEMLEKDPYELLFLAIKKNGFDEVNLAKMIGAAKQDIHTGSIAAKMEDLQFQKWSKDGKSSEDLFKFLGLNKEGDKLFDSPAWSIWASYLNRQELNPS
ncbi:hypothetical protein GQ600_7469 [Phytophthora cactorum]|nr:hypothetical protein GQ600_7469 [Phytophthora cactorum]